MQSVIDRKDFNPEYQEGYQKGWQDGYVHNGKFHEMIRNQDKDFWTVTIMYAMFLIVVFGACFLSMVEITWK